MKEFSVLKIIKIAIRENPSVKRLILVGIISNLVVVVLQAARPYIIKVAIDDYVLKGAIEKTMLFAGFVLTLMLIEGLSSYIYDRYTQILGIKVTYTIRDKMVRHLFSLPKRYFDEHRSAVINTRITSDVEATGSIFSEGLLKLAGEFVLIIVALAFMVSVNPILTAIVVTIVSILAIISWKFRKIASNVFSQIRKTIAQFNVFLQEQIMGKLVVELFNRKEKHYRQFDELNQTYYQQYKHAVILFALFFPVVELFLTIAISGIVLVGSHQIMHGKSTPGEIVSFIMYLYILFQPLRNIAEKVYTLEMGNVASKRILEFLNEQTIKDDFAVREVPPSYEIKFHNVSFGYYPEAPVIKNVSFCIKEGERVLIMGPTGEGKTTILNLICGHYLPVQGTISIGGHDISQIEPSVLRKLISFITQDSYFFSGTILDNITLFDRNSPRITIIRDIVKHHFSDILPDLNYHVVEHARNLTPSQKQIISFLRIFIFDSKIIMMDEATASLTQNIEKVLFQLIDEYYPASTVIVVSHRPHPVFQPTLILKVSNQQVQEIRNVSKFQLEH